VFIISAIEKAIEKGVDAGVDASGRKISKAIDQRKQNKAVEQQFCAKCGSPVGKSVSFCEKCGTKISAGK
jgi:hypothetical protein